MRMRSCALSRPKNVEESLFTLTRWSGLSPVLGSATFLPRSAHLEACVPNSTTVARAILKLSLLLALLPAAPSAKAEETVVIPGFGATSRVLASHAFVQDEAVGNVLERRSHRALFDQRLTTEGRRASLSPDFDDAIRRIEAIHDPTRIGVFGRALTMEVRAGTASMNNVFGDRWRIADGDPNIHYRSRYLGRVWMFDNERSCDALRRFRPDDALIVFDRLAEPDCRRVQKSRFDEASKYIEVDRAPLSLPIFASPYAGGRFSLEGMRAAQQARILAIRERLRLKWYRAQL